MNNFYMTDCHMIKFDMTDCHMTKFDMTDSDPVVCTYVRMYIARAPNLVLMVYHCATDTTAGTDRLDKDLTIGQMQGESQSAGCGDLIGHHMQLEL